MSNCLLSLFVCPVCYDYIFRPIFQCNSGHIVCYECHLKLIHCPICGEVLGYIRNIAMEKVAELIKFPCKHSGCKETVLFASKTNHENTCEFRVYPCPYADNLCRWQGRLNEVTPHVKKSHPQIKNLEGHDIVFLASKINIHGNYNWTITQTCYNHFFLFKLKKRENGDGFNEFSAEVQFIGPSNIGNKFLYKLKIQKPHTSLIWEGTPHSIQDDPATKPIRIAFDLAHVLTVNCDILINITILRA